MILDPLFERTFEFSHSLALQRTAAQPGELQAGFRGRRPLSTGSLAS
jgi:hypothetical protein